jgi:hypothetical protein
MHAWFDFLFYSTSLGTGSSETERITAFESAAAGVLDPTTHYNLLHEFSHAISSASPAYWAIRILRLDALLRAGGLTAPLPDGRYAIDLRHVGTEVLDRIVIKSYVADVLQAYLSPAFEGLACFSELHAIPSSKTYKQFRPISELFATMQEASFSPVVRPLRIVPASKRDRVRRKREIIENPAHRSDGRLSILAQPIQDQSISGGYLLGYNWMQSIYHAYQATMDPEEFVYAMMDLFFFDTQVYRRALSADTFEKAEAFHKYIRERIFEIVSGAVGVGQVVRHRDDGPNFYVCPHVWPGQSIRSLRMTRGEATKFGQRLAADMQDVHELLESVTYQNKLAVFLAIRADPMVTVAVVQAESIEPNGKGARLALPTDGGLHYCELDAFSWLPKKELISHAHYSYTFNLLGSVKPILGIYGRNFVETFSSVGDAQAPLDMIHEPASRYYNDHLQTVIDDAESLVDKVRELAGVPSLAVARPSLARSRNDVWYGALPSGSLLFHFHASHNAIKQIKSVRDIDGGAQPMVLPNGLRNRFGPIDFVKLCSLANKTTGASTDGTYPILPEELQAAKQFHELVKDHYIRVNDRQNCVWPIF